MSAPPPQRRWEKVVEIVEVSALAIVAIATAFSGYQGSQWGGEQARLYGLASSTRFEADAAATLGGQELVADSSFFTAWLQAHEAGDRQLEAMMEKRFSPAYAVAFQDWLATDPFVIRRLTTTSSALSDARIACTSATGAPATNAHRSTK